LKRWLFALAAACGEPPLPPPVAPHPAPAAPAPGPYHDPDHKRGALPTQADRRRELAVLREHLDAMYAHRLAKEQRYAIDEDAVFAEADRRLVAAHSWAGYDDAIYDALATFHDSHLSYHPPQTAAPSRGYTPYRLGVDTVLADGHLLISAVDPGSDAAAAGVAPGDEVIAIDGRPIDKVLDGVVRGRVWSRAESAQSSFARTWSHVLVPVGESSRPRSIRVRLRAGGERPVAITPREAPKLVHDVITSARDGDVAIVTIRSLEGNRTRARAIDDALAAARGAPGLVIDLRGDRGGVDVVGYRVVAALAEGSALIGTYRVKVSRELAALRPRWKDLAAGPDGFSPAQQMTVAAQPAGKGYRGALAVVVDAGCVSTCELVAAALRADLHATVVGEVTGGSTGAPVEITLPVSKADVAIPTWDMIAADGKPVESDGVVPDVPAVATADALAAGRDLPLEAALAAVRARLRPQ